MATFTYYKFVVGPGEALQFFLHKNLHGGTRTSSPCLILPLVLGRIIPGFFPGEGGFQCPLHPSVRLGHEQAVGLLACS